MKLCDVCENQYEKYFEVLKDGKTYTFDSFECAINKLAPHCKKCSCRIIGHGIEAGGDYYCCAHCARKDGIHEAKDNIK